jgi:hypothetical protein
MILMDSQSSQNLKGFNLMLNDHIMLLSTTTLMQVWLSICLRSGFCLSFFTIKLQ